MRAPAGRRFSDRYARRMADAGASHEPHAARGYRIGPDGATISERLLQCIWFDQLVRPDALRTADGRRVRVHAPGFWNFEAGPDFLAAELQFDDAPPVRGDVEIHFQPTDWIAHGHAQDPRFNGTALHVVFRNPQNGVAVRTASGRTVPQVALADALVDRLDALRARLDTDEYPYASALNVGQCAQRGLTGASRKFWDLVALAGEARLLLKARRAAALSPDWDQVCYAMVLQALGYKQFAAACGTLAERVPYARLRVLAAQTGAAPHLTAEAAVLGMAGLLPADPAVVPHPEGRARAQDLLARWQTVRHHFDAEPMTAAAWHAPSVRPANRPARRLAAAARLVAQTFEAGLAQTLRLCAANDLTPRNAWRRLETLLLVEADSFWAHRGSVESAPWPRAQRLVGPARARVLSIDAVVPALLAWARATEDVALEIRLHAMVSGAPAQALNAKLRLALYRTTGSASEWPREWRTALHGQGLLHLLQEWCVERPTCEGCGVWAALAEGAAARKRKRAKAPI